MTIPPSGPHGQDQISNKWPNFQKSSFLLLYILRKKKMHDFDVHEALNQNYEIHGSWDSG